MPTIATDGSSLGTPTPDGPRKAEGPGAYGVVIRFEDEHPRAPGFVQEMVGGRRSTTTGEIELLGFLTALEAVRDLKEAMEADPESSLMVDGDFYTIVLDSEYVAKGFTEHLDGWAENAWRTNGFRAIKHQVLWQDVHDLRAEIGNIVAVVHQKGHTRRAGDLEVDPHVEINDMADKAAGVASRLIRDTGYVPIPKAIVWSSAKNAAPDMEGDMRKLQALAERVLKVHGRNAAVEAFRRATHATGVRE
jgi:ribonuclease HI